MKQNFLRELPRWLIPVAGGAVLVFSVLIYVIVMRVPYRPPTLVLSACREVPPGMRRFGVHGLGSEFSIQFDISEKDFTIHSGMNDMPPGSMFYAVTLKGLNAHVEVLNDYIPSEDQRSSSFPVLSEHAEERDVLSSEWGKFGEDRWGYLSSGERWRQVRFRGGIFAKYGLVDKKAAELFDQIIHSACITPDSDSPSGMLHKQ